LSLDSALLVREQYAALRVDGRQALEGELLLGRQRLLACLVTTRARHVDPRRWRALGWHSRWALGSIAVAVGDTVARAAAATVRLAADHEHAIEQGG